MLTKKAILSINEDPKKFASTIDTPKLVKILEKLRHLYYNVGESPISDEKFDQLEDELRKVAPNDKYFTMVGSGSDKFVKLPYNLPSLNKIKNDDTITLDKWLKTYQGTYIISDKLDGVSALLVNDNNKYKMYTR